MPSLSAFELVPSEAVKHEWLLSNGAGGYSSSTAIGMNTRKYHGLLIAPLRGCNGRHVMLSKLEETAKAGSTEFSLSTNSYPGAVFPQGFRHQTSFAFETHPIFSYSLNGTRLEKSVRMLHGHDAVLVSYRLASGKEAGLEIRPMLSPRGIHEDPKAAAAGLEFESDRAGFEIKKPARMRVCSSFGKFVRSPQHYNNMVYETEKQRGYPATETLFSPGFFSATLSRNDELHICASLDPAGSARRLSSSAGDGLAPSQALEIIDRQSFRLNHLSEEYARLNGFSRTDFSDALVAAADSFICIRLAHKGITAGFHWFSEWGRDTMISLPGLLISTGRASLARELLIEHGKRLKNGLLPNFTDEGGNQHYNSSDAALWFINAIRQYEEATGDHYTIQKQLWSRMKEWLNGTVEGNALVRLDSDGLLRVLDPSSTWMDAKIAGKPVTPRKGKPIEINALWHSNLHFMNSLAEKFGDNKAAQQCASLAERSASSFQKFLSAEGEGGLMDLLEPNDASLRPNQLFAFSLPHSPLNHLQQKHAFNLVRSRLYTPLGIRTLAPGDSHYHEEYGGNQEARDVAYHQGMVWPWLLGAFYDAQLNIHPGSEAQVLASLKPFADAIKQGCMGTLPELYEPKTMQPAGAVSQAWSVAEILRIYTKVKKAAAQQQPQKQEWKRQIASAARGA